MSDTSQNADVEGRNLSPSEDEIVRAPQPAPKRRKHARLQDGARCGKGKRGTGREPFSVPRHNDDEDVDEDSFFTRARTSRQAQRLQALIDCR
ncbi:MAG: hypothetical protein BJ554DRAFT_4315 [Olpidium bornovanus]|uniref:Uncharacterized protein n=1 Tax=Olpidium bornovanus TaxID=278681 RepID=A0A8H7ZMW0_9FUNG|nr:MAG: hypothetical protein BJ554DRAFT_4315 [Olpidium bornovanus]